MAGSLSLMARSPDPEASRLSGSTARALTHVVSMSSKGAQQGLGGQKAGGEGGARAASSGWAASTWEALRSTRRKRCSSAEAEPWSNSRSRAAMPVALSLACSQEVIQQQAIELALVAGRREVVADPAPGVGVGQLVGIAPGIDQAGMGLG